MIFNKKQKGQYKMFFRSGVTEDYFNDDDIKSLIKLKLTKQIENGRLYYCSSKMKYLQKVFGKYIIAEYVSGNKKENDDGYSPVIS